MARPSRVAAIDLGTNTTLMLVAQLDDRGALMVLEDRATITRLGGGVDHSGLLEQAAIKRTLDVLRGYSRSAIGWGADIVAVGTSALRDAQNRDDFLTEAREVLGVDVQTIAGLREAELTFVGAFEGLDVGRELWTVVDIGGGSTEIIVGGGGRILRRMSVDVGSVRMHERHRLSMPAAPEEVAAMRAEIRQLLAADRSFAPVPRLLAIAGTATTLAAIVGRVDPYDRTRVHGAKLTGDEVRCQARQLLATTLEARRNIVGLDPARADVIAAGAVILEEVLDWTAAVAVTVSDGGVRFGLAREALTQPAVD